MRLAIAFETRGVGGKDAQGAEDSSYSSVLDARLTQEANLHWAGLTQGRPDEALDCMAINTRNGQCSTSANTRAIPSRSRLVCLEVSIGSSAVIVVDSLEGRERGVWENKTFRS